MARFGYTLTLPTITGTHSNEVILLRAKEFPTSAIDGGASSLPNGGGSSRYYTDDTKATQIPADVFSFVTGVTPLIHVEVKLPSAFTGATIYVEDDTVATIQPAVTDTYGRNSVHNVLYEFVSHDLITDSTGHYPSSFTVTGSPTQVDSPYGIPNAAYSFSGTNQWIDVATADLTARDPLDLVEITDFITIQGIVKSSNVSDTFNRIVHIRDSGVKNIQFMQNNDGNSTFGLAFASANAATQSVAKVSADATVFNQLTGIGELTGTAAPAAGTEIYIDGDNTSNTINTTGLGGGTVRRAIRIGARTDGNGDFFGTASEIRYRKNAIDPDWLAAETANRDPYDASPWGTVGAWVDQDAGGAITVSDTTSNTNSSNNIDIVALVGAFNVSDSVVNSLSQSNTDSITLTALLTVSDSTTNSNVSSNTDTIKVVGEFSITEALTNSNSVSNNDAVNLAASVLISDQASNSNSSSNTDTIKVVGEFSITEALTNSNSVSNNDAVNLAASVLISDQASNSNSSSNTDTIKVVGEFSIADAQSTTTTNDGTDIVAFASIVSIADNTTNSNSLNNSDSVSFVGQFNIEDFVSSSSSISNADTIQLVGKVNVTGSQTNTNSASNSDTVLIGTFAFNVNDETDISALTKSRNILALTLSTNINAVTLSTNING